MRKPSVFISRLIADKALVLLRASCDADTWDGDMPPTAEELAARARKAEGVLVLLTDRIDEPLLSQCPLLKVVSNMAVGVDNVNVPAATARGIPVGHTPGVLTEATADMAMALMLSAARRVVEGDRFVHDGQWQTWGPRILLGLDLEGAQLGILGFGRIGKAVARRAQGFGMRLRYCDHDATPAYGAEPMDFEELLQSSDFLTLHVPLTAATAGLIDAHSLGLMKPGAVLINTSRGGVVDHDALHQALQSGHLFAAALDVTEPEPLPVDHPLLQLTNCIVVPHVGSASKGARERMAMMAAENLLAGLRGERLPNCANPEVYTV
jgi:lactate dehydrogenase-like 2-hydroxyacid dehydrogenase